MGDDLYSRAIYTIFLLSERISCRRESGRHPEPEKLHLVSREILSQDAISARTGNVLVAIRNPRHMDHLQRVLERTDTRKIDIVALTVKRQGFGGYELHTDQIFSDQVAELFRKVVALAEKAGKPVELLADIRKEVSDGEPFDKYTEFTGSSLGSGPVG